MRLLNHCETGCVWQDIGEAYHSHRRPGVICCCICGCSHADCRRITSSSMSTSGSTLRRRSKRRRRHCALLCHHLAHIYTGTAKANCATGGKTRSPEPHHDRSCRPELSSLVCCYELSVLPRISLSAVLLVLTLRFVSTMCTHRVVGSLTPGCGVAVPT